MTLSQALQTKTRTFPKKSNYLSYYFILLLSALIPVAAVGIFNYLIDPYDVFNTPDFLGVNHEKPLQDNNDRLYRALDVIRNKPIKTLIIGSSRTKQGIDPSSPSLSAEQPAYNLAINGPNMYEVRRYLEHAIANQDQLKKVILGIDFFMFNQNLKNQATFSENRLGKHTIIVSDLINSLFSIDAVNASQKTIAASRKVQDLKDGYGDNGFRPNRNMNDGNTKWRVKQSLGVYFSFHNNYELSQNFLDDFRKIVELCQKNNIELIVFISPSHAVNWEAVRTTKRWDVLEDWKREIVKVTPVWDFSGYNSITTEAIQDRMDNYVDDSHYKPSIGNRILERIMGKNDSTQVPQDFGMLITPENIEQELQQIRTNLETWAKSNPDLIELVEKSYRDFQSAKKN